MTHRWAVLSLLLTACGSAEGRTALDCRDGADNDGDGLFDCNDPGCMGSPDCDVALDAGRDAGTADDAGSDGGMDAGFDIVMQCRDACMSLFACGLEGGPPMDAQLCPRFVAADELAFVDGCVVSCESTPALLSLINPADCSTTITTISAVNANFDAACRVVCCSEQYPSEHERWLEYVLAPCGCAASNACSGDCELDPACSTSGQPEPACVACLDLGYGDACALGANDMCELDVACQPYSACREEPDSC